MLIKNSNQPIGVFDSGVGGLSVVKSIRKLLPLEHIIYFGDIARIPYGTKSAATIKHFASETVNFLLDKQVKAIAIACNTISAVAKEEVLAIATQANKIPVIDIISPAVNFVVKQNYQRIGIIATPATIKAKAYEQSIIQQNSAIKIFANACGLFVPFIEEGIMDHKALELIAYEYLKPLLDNNLDSLILGCTHYPLIINTIKRVIKNISATKIITIVDPSIIMANTIKELLAAHNLLNTSSHKDDCETNDATQAPLLKKQHSYYVTDIPLNFKKIGELFLQEEMTNLHLVNID